MPVSTIVMSVSHSYQFPLTPSFARSPAPISPLRCSCSCCSKSCTCTRSCTSKNISSPSICGSCCSSLSPCSATSSACSSPSYRSSIPRSGSDGSNSCKCCFDGCRFDYCKRNEPCSGLGWSLSTGSCCRRPSVRQPSCYWKCIRRSSAIFLQLPTGFIRSAVCSDLRTVRYGLQKLLVGYKGRSYALPVLSVSSFALFPPTPSCCRLLKLTCYLSLHYSDQFRACSANMST